MTRAVVLAGGLGHPPEETVPTVIDLLGDAAEVDVRTPTGSGGIDAGLAALDPDVHDLLVVAALAFEMDADRYDDLRTEHAFHLDDAGRAAIERFAAARRPILGLHTAVISFGNWSGWGDLLGGRWNWERSWHPPLTDLTVTTTPDAFGSKASAGRMQTVVPGHVFVVHDEHYRDLDLADDLDVVARVDGQPVAWRRTTAAGGRTGCSLLGHDHRSFAVPGHRALLAALLDWLLEDPCPA